MTSSTNSVLTIASSLTPAIESLTAQLQAIAEATRNAEEAFNQARAHVEAFSTRITAAANTPVGIARLEGRYYVLGGLDPDYADPALLDLLVSEILSGDADGCWLLTPANRAVVAASAIRGWARHRRGQQPNPAGIAWGRLPTPTED